MTLTEFLLARIAEDEKAARKAARFPYDEPTDAPWERARLAVASGVSTSSDAHIARHDPARALRECEAHRALVESAQMIIDSFGDWDATPGALAMWPDVSRRERSQAHARLHALADIYSDHPDYLPEWRLEAAE